MKISILYRACGSEVYSPIKPERPNWFSKINTWRNFYKEFGNQNFDIHVIWDGDRNFLSNQMDDLKDVKFHPIYERDNQKSLLYCYKLAEELNSEGYYFLEDDYLHAPGAQRILSEALPALGMVTLYDHPDRYRLPSNDISFGQDLILAGELCHFRTCESTTCTVAMTNQTFKNVKKELIHFCEKGIGAPEDRSFYRYVLTQKNARLFSPLPGYSTHCVQAYLSPYQDWELINRKALM